MKKRLFIEGIAKLAAWSKFYDFFVGPVFRKVTYHIGHRHFAKNLDPTKKARIWVRRSFAIPYIISALLFFSNLNFGLLSADDQFSDDRVIQYQISSEEFGVVVVQKEGMSEKDAKNYAMQKAAETAQKYNYQYFVIQTEGQVMVTNTKSSQTPEQQMPRNMYYELFQSDNFGRQPMDQNTIPQAGLYPAYRIVFKCSKSMPVSGGIDACKVIDCNK